MVLMPVDGDSCGWGLGREIGGKDVFSRWERLGLQYRVQ